MFLKTARFFLSIPKPIKKIGNASLYTSRILTPSCLGFIESLHKKYNSDYQDCLNLRKTQKKYDFRDDTKFIRDMEWKINKLPLQKRHVEITGPANNTKMVINAFNCGADGYMIDFEDSMTPSWKNIIDGHSNTYEAIRRTLTDVKYDNSGNIIKEYKINPGKLPYLFVRPRGLHMKESNVFDSMSATIFDIGTFLFHNATYLSSRKLGPYLYIPKLESYEEALFINDIIKDSQKMLGIPHGTVKTTVLLETYPAIFQTEEIIYALKDHIIGLNCGRWDYLFSMIKCLGNNKILPDRDMLTMNQPFLEAYVHQIVNSCHKRGIHAMGGMSAFIPTGDESKDKEIGNTIAKDKILEIARGCDGAWVAHPKLVSSIQNVFTTHLKKDHQIDTYNTDTEITSEMLSEIEGNSYTSSTLKNNISIALQYISAWLSGNGAVALNGLMEDLATAEISIHQIKQWYNISLILSDNNKKLDEKLFEKYLDDEYNKMLEDGQVKYAQHYYDFAKQICRKYVYGDYRFLTDVASKYLENKNGFKGIQFDQETIHKLHGSKGYLTGVELTKHRGEYLHKYLYEDNNAAYKFLGTSNGVAAVNVVAGGNGTVGPYAGGWQTNAMKNRLGMLLPDTLHVSPEESATCASEINNHLHRADSIQHVQKLTNKDFTGNINYYDMALLADMEQGWNTPEKIRIATIKAIQNGINIIHIEDQGEKKRCGHLGDKELNTYEDYALMLRSANLAAQEVLGSEQAHKQWFRIVARTDAYSATRIVNSSNLYNTNNDEYKFIDWERGYSPDGKYLYLKNGINPDSGKSWGLELSIQRCAKVVDQGLASHVWMETPDADLDVARDFLMGVNEILIPKGKKAYGLYNHSPSFDWDIKFFEEAQSLAKEVAEDIKHFLIKADNDIFVSTGVDTTNQELHQEISDSLIFHGSKNKGDHIFTNENIHKILINIIEYYYGEGRWLARSYKYAHNTDFSTLSNEISKYVQAKVEKGYSPLDNIAEIIVDQRLCNFSNMLSSFGFNLHLITLPEFHVTAFNMHKLSKDFSVNGINAFVKYTQRPERILMEKDNTYTYYKHQTATGTGVEAAFSEAAGSSSEDMLSGSTESDDIKKRNS